MRVQKPSTQDTSATLTGIRDIVADFEAIR